ncbi:MAG: Flp family type IVb pilin [Novosphingobium sp.]
MTRLRTLSKIPRDTRGATSVEYGVILAMIVLVIFLAMQGLADETISMWDTVSTKSTNAISGH